MKFQYVRDEKGVPGLRVKNMKKDSDINVVKSCRDHSKLGQDKSSREKRLGFEIFKVAKEL